MWSVQFEELAEARGVRLVWERNSQPATYAQAIDAWRTEAAFRELFNATLAEVPFTAFRWESPAVTFQTSTRGYECVLLDSPSLARPFDIFAFAEQFPDAVDDVAVFPNLGGDATMIVPVPLVTGTAYGHLAAFVRLAPQPQQQALWRAVGEVMSQRLGAKPVWLSTAGAGVSWLHVRLDDRPKYYGYEPYRRSG